MVSSRNSRLSLAMTAAAVLPEEVMCQSSLPYMGFRKGEKGGEEKMD